MCQVMGFLMRRRLGSRAEAGIPKLGPPDLGFPTAGVGVSLPCPEGEQARRMGSSHHPVCDTLAAPCRLGSREALSLRFLSLSGSPTSCLEAGMQDLPLFRGRSRWVQAPGSPLVARLRPVALYPSHEHVSSDAHHSPFLNPL